jgi:hypothetical protein
VGSDTLHVDLVTGALQEKSARCVSQDRKKSVVHRSEDPLGLFLLSKRETRMDRTDCVIQLAQQFVRIVECAVGKDIDLGGLEDTDSIEMLVQLVNLSNLCPKFFFGNAPGDLQTL